MLIYTIGYLGDNKVYKGQRKPDTLKSVVERIDGQLFDIRFSPFSLAPCWRKPSFEALLGDRYTWLPALGNRNYRGGEVEIADMNTGLGIVLASRRTPILMCACEHWRYCHRYVVAQALGKRNEVEDVIEIPHWGRFLEEHH